MSINTRSIQSARPIPLFGGIGNVSNRVFIFGGKEPDTRQITNKSFELIWKEGEEQLTLKPINRMFKIRSRSTVACINHKIDNFEPFLVIIGGADESQPMSSCELYYPPTETFYAFPSLASGRENASSCVFKAQKDPNQSGREGIWIYVFGGFDKKAADEIERIRISFDPEVSNHPIVATKWERLKDASMLKPVECCGTFQLSEYEIMIFGGMQKGEESENKQLLIFNTENYSFIGVQSYLKHTDYF